MVKKITTVLMLLSIASPLLAFAQSGTVGGGISIPGVTKPALRSNLDISATLNLFINFFFSLLIALSVFFVLYAAFLYMRSGGEAEDTTKARNYLIYSAIAIAVAIFSQALPGLVDSILR